MKNDDFMYSRQEEPNPAFVTSLQEQLTQEDINPVRSSRSWNRFVRLSASIILLGFVLLLISPDVRAFVVQTLQIDGWIAVSEEDAQAYFPFVVPQAIPDGYERRVQWYDGDDSENDADVYLTSIDIGNEQVIGHMAWHNETNNCWMMLTIFENRNSPEIVARSLQQAEEFSRFDWIDVFEVDGVQAVWRIKTQSGGINNMEIEWLSSDNIVHRLDTSSECMTQAEFTAIAQSVG